MKLKKKKKKKYFFFEFFFFFFLKSPESAPKFSDRSGNRKHNYFFFLPNVYTKFGLILSIRSQDIE